MKFFLFSLVSKTNNSPVINLWVNLKKKALLANKYNTVSYNPRNRVPIRNQPYFFSYFH